MPASPATGRTFVRAWILALAATLGGCSASELLQNRPVGPAPDLSQPNYHRIVAESIKTIFPKPSSLGELEISGVRLVDHLKGTVWLTCLRLDARGHPQQYAIFIQGDKVIDWREGILMDQCHKETYTPLEISAAAKKPGT
jgi:hypothetical protein